MRLSIGFVCRRRTNFTIIVSSVAACQTLHRFLFAHEPREEVLSCIKIVFATERADSATFSHWYFAGQWRDGTGLPDLWLPQGKQDSKADYRGIVLSFPELASTPNSGMDLWASQHRIFGCARTGRVPLPTFKSHLRNWNSLNPFQINMNTLELEEARWFGLEEVVEGLKRGPRSSKQDNGSFLPWFPPKQAIAHQLICEWVKQQTSQPA